MMIINKRTRTRHKQFYWSRVYCSSFVKYNSVASSLLPLNPVANPCTTMSLMAKYRDPDLNLEWSSTSFDEVISITHIGLRGKDIGLSYRWLDPKPPASERRHWIYLFYKTGPWFEFSFWVKHVLSQVPCSKLLTSTWQLDQTCRIINDNLTDAIESRDPLPKPDPTMPKKPSTSFRPPPPIPTQDDELDDDLDIMSTVGVVGKSSSHDIWGFSS